MLAQERDERHEDARRAEAALQPVSLAERGLKRMQRVARAVSEALHGLDLVAVRLDGEHEAGADRLAVQQDGAGAAHPELASNVRDRKSTRLNSSHSQISYAVFCLKKKKMQNVLLF